MASSSQDLETVALARTLQGTPSDCKEYDNMISGMLYISFSHLNC